MMPVSQLTRHALLWQLVMFIAVLIPHLPRLPVWLPLLAAVTIGWRYMIFVGRWSFPNGLFKFCLLAATGIGVLLSAGKQVGMEATVSLLIAGFALKTLELNKQRDALVLVYVAYFVAATHFLFEQGIPHALYIFLLLILITASLNAACQTEQQRDFWRPLKRSLKLNLQALPLMLVLFVLMPRVGPLWSVELNQTVGRTGLSDQLSPGDVSQLTRSSAVAFRAEFDGFIPAERERYWRGVVYSEFDGVKWVVGDPAPAVQPPRVQTARRYELLLEPSGNNWAYSLDYPVRLGSGLQLHADNTVRFNGKLSQRQTISLAYSSEKQPDRRLDGMDFSRYLQLPRSGNPRTRVLVAELLQQGLTREQLIDEILGRFNHRFIYTLSPPLMSGRNGIDQFMFDNQRGFCGHYSSAMAFMLRLAGIPARIVGGYQGGEWNPYEQYMLVRQYEAHAWVEAWLDGQGWVRLDPTAAVAPERVEQAADQLFAEEDGFLADEPLSVLRLGRDSWLNELRLQYEAFNYQWQRWVVNYHHQQHGLLKDLLGEVNHWRLVGALLIPFVLILGGIAWGLLRRGRKATLHPVDQQYVELTTVLADMGISRGQGEAPGDFASRVSDLFPPVAEEWQKLTELYQQLRYAEADDPSVLRTFNTQAEQCRIAFRRNRGRFNLSPSETQ